LPRTRPPPHSRWAISNPLSSPFPWIKWFLPTVKKYNLSHVDDSARWLPFVDCYNLAQLSLVNTIRSRWFSVVDSFMRCSRCTAGLHNLGQIALSASLY
jgi:hypothetical protein